MDADAGYRVGGVEGSDQGIAVQKQWLPWVEDRHLLIESVRWDLAAPDLEKLRAAAAPAQSAGSQGSDILLASGGSSARDLKSILASQRGRAQDGKIQLAKADEIATAGYVLDFIIIPESQVTLFPSGVTFYIQTQYYFSVSVTFQGGTIVKYKNNAHLRFFGSMTFPSAPPHAIFTSRNDDLYGERIINVPSEPGQNSDGDPTKHRALEALFVYYQAAANTVRNVRVRWAQTCVRYLGTAASISHTFQNSLLEHSLTGMNISVPVTSSVTINNVTQSDVTTAITGGYYSGTIANVITNASNWPNHQAEPAIAVRQQTAGDLLNTKVVIVALSRTLGNQSDQGMVRMISSDGGRTWPTVGYIATGAGGDLPLADGDADPAMVYDSFGNLLLAYRKANAGGVICCISDNNGMNWTEVVGFAGSAFPGSTPRIAVSPLIAGKCYLWLSLHDGLSRIQCAGAEIRGLGSNNVAGVNSWRWTPFLFNSEGVKFHSIAVGPAGDVMLVATQPLSGARPITFRTARNPKGYPSTTFSTVSADFTLPNMGFTEEIPMALVDVLPVLAWDRTRNELYLSYTTRKTGAPNVDTDIAVKKYNWSASNNNWGSELAIHPASSRSQFHPWIAVDEGSGFLATIWYDTKDSADDKHAHVYAAIIRDRFLTGLSPYVFRLSLNPASLDQAGGFLLKEYIGATAFGGFLYPAFLNNGTPSATAWDIFDGRVPL